MGIQSCIFHILDTAYIFQGHIQDVLQGGMLHWKGTQTRKTLNQKNMISSKEEKVITHTLDIFKAAVGAQTQHREEWYIP